MEGVMARSVPNVVALVVWLIAPAPPEKKTITPAEARTHIGHNATVCGKIVSVQKGFSPSGRAWHLQFDLATPPIFTVIVGGNTIDNPAFIDADKRYANKDVCVEGLILERNGMVYTAPTTPGRIRIVKDKS
jgi:hypothetical protein